jgi:hypothetical protein
MSTTSLASLKLLTSARTSKWATESPPQKREAPAFCWHLSKQRTQEDLPGSPPLMRRKVSGYGQVPQGFLEKGPNVEVHPAIVDFPTAAAPPFIADGERDGRFPDPSSTETPKTHHPRLHNPIQV